MISVVARTKVHSEALPSIVESRGSVDAVVSVTLDYKEQVPIRGGDCDSARPVHL